MTTYTLSYEIDIEAETPEEAVRQATDFARNTEGIASWAVQTEAGPVGLFHFLPDGRVSDEYPEAEEDDTGANPPDEQGYFSCAKCGQRTHENDESVRRDGRYRYCSDRCREGH